MKNKAELIAELAARTDETKASAERFLTAFQDLVIEEVAAGSEVKLTGFVAFTPGVRAAREMRNPRTGEKVSVPETRTVRVRVLKRFRDAMGK